MKRIFLTLATMIVAVSSYSQSYKDTFDSNSLGWDEYVGKRGEAVIKDGVLHLKASEKGDFILSTCYLPVDVTQNFEITAKLINTKVDDEERGVGIILNYMDDYNYDAFILSKDVATYRRYVDGKLVGFRTAQIKIDKKVKDHNLVIKSTFQKLEFLVDNMKALEVRYAPIKYSGFGIGAWAADDSQVVDVDEIEIKQ